MFMSHFRSLTSFGEHRPFSYSAIEDALEYPTKGDMPLLKLGYMRDLKTLVSIIGVECDYDGGVMTMDEAASLLGIDCILYTTPRHTAAAPRWRVLALLSHQMPATARRSLVGQVNRLLGGVLAPESFVDVQRFYYGKVKDVPYKHLRVHGPALDTLGDCIEPLYPVGRSHEPVAVARPKRDDYDLGEIRSALAAIPSDDRDTWVAVGQALACLGEEGYKLWGEWSKTSAKYNPDDMGRWGTFSGDHTGPEAIFSRAQKLGWVNPRSRRAIDTSTVGFGAPRVSHPFTDAGNGLRMRDIFGQDMRRIVGSPDWMTFIDGRWVRDMGGDAVLNNAQSLHRHIEAEGDDAFKWSIKSQSLSTMRAAQTCAGLLPELRVSQEQIDSCLDVIGLDGGRQVLTLRTGEVRPARREDYVLKSMGVPFVGDAAKATRWALFLREVFKGDEDLIEYVRRFIGYCLTGSTKEQVFLFLYGEGSNGKSVFIKIITSLLGTYGKTLGSETITESRRGAGSATPDLADLAGARLGSCSEIEDYGRIAEGLIKGLVSGDTRDVRKLHCAPFPLAPILKIIMSGNDKPSVRSTDDGLWRRIRLIPFVKVFRLDERDNELEATLLGELPHIAAWAAQACVDWHRHGIGPVPKACADATDEYRKQTDIVGEWVADNVDHKSGNNVKFSEIYANYQGWCIQNGQKPIPSNKLTARLGKYGFEKWRDKKDKGLSGLILR